MGIDVFPFIYIYTYIIYIYIVQSCPYDSICIYYIHIILVYTPSGKQTLWFPCVFYIFPCRCFLQIAIVWWMFGCCFFVAPLNWWGKKYRTELKKRERGDLKKWPSFVSELRGPICFMDFIMGVNPKLYQHRPQIAKTHFCVINVDDSTTSARSSTQFFFTPHTLQWHPAMAPSNGILVPPPLPQSWPTIVSPHHSTLQWHPAMAPWCHVQSAKVVRRPPPLLEVRTPIAKAIWGNRGKTTKMDGL